MENFLLENVSKEDILALQCKINLHGHKDKSKKEILQVLVQNRNKKQAEHDVGLLRSLLLVKGIGCSENRVKEFCVDLGLSPNISKRVYDILYLTDKPRSFIIQEDGIRIRCDKQEVFLSYKEILYIEALADYIIIKTHKKRYVTQISMKDMVLELPSDIFARTHRGFIVNKEKITSIELSTICIQNSTGSHFVPIGKVYKASFRKSLPIGVTKRGETDGSLDREIAKAYHDAGDLDRAEACYHAIISRADQKQQTAKAYIGLGIIYYNKGSHQKSKEYYTKGLKLAEELQDVDIQNIALQALGLRSFK